MRKISILLIAIVVFAFSFASVGCEKASASASVSVGQNHVEFPSEIKSEKSSIGNNAVDALLGSKTFELATTPAKGEPSRIQFQAYDTDPPGYSYIFANDRAKPPSFTGLGGDHFARADV